MLTNHFSTTDIEIQVLPRQAAGYPVDLLLDGKQVFHGQMPAEIRERLAAAPPEKAGAALFDVLLSGPDLLYGWAQGRRAKTCRVRLNIHPGAAELHSLPWELLRYREEWIAAGPGTPFSRYLPVDAAWGEPAQAKPVRVLAAVSNPGDLAEHNLAPVNVDEEKRAIESGLAGLRGRVEVEYLDRNVTLSALEDRLRSGFHILHFVGHGLLNTDRSHAALVLQRNGNESAFIPDDAVAQMLRGLAARPSLVFLTACQSAARSADNAFLGLAPRLVRAGAPAVIAMQGPLSMSSSPLLHRVFYQQLCADHPVDMALNEARAALITAGQADFDIPVLFMRIEDGRLWPAAKPAPEPAGAEEETPARQEARNIHTGGGAYIGGNVHVKGDFVGRDKIVYQNQGPAAEPAPLEAIFASLRRAALRVPAAERPDLVHALEVLESESGLGASANEKRVRRAFANLRDISEEVWQASVDALKEPVEGLSLVVQKAAKEEDEG